jgi:uncharacterized protein (DUF1684 family)
MTTNSRTAHAGPGDEAFVRHVLAERLAKDDYFRHSPHSPLPHERQHDFIGLSYFAPEPAYRLTGLRVERTSEEDARPFLIETSDRQPRTAYRLGRLSFVVGRTELALTAYRIGDDTSDTLFIPFKDRTSGRETYGMGRYLDIEPEPDGTYTLDFNAAYNPFCAYSELYSCPLPPPENTLPVPIKAGERYSETGY